MFPPLSGLSGLTELYLNNNTIDEIGPQPNGSVLKKLSVAHNKLSAIDGISGMTKLTEADFSANKVVQIEILSNLAELRQLNLKENPLPENWKCPLALDEYCFF